MLLSDPCGDDLVNILSACLFALFFCFALSCFCLLLFFFLRLLHVYECMNQ